LRDIVKEHLGIDICNYLDCKLNENKNSNSRIFENWRRYLNEDLESKIREAIALEGGAADMEALKEYTGATEEEIKSAMGNWEGVEESPDSTPGASTSYLLK
jgi:hypothetical protein